MSETTPTPEEQAAEMQEQAAAEALGVKPVTVEIPPGVRTGVTLFELEDGNFGFMPTSERTTIMDVYALCSRILVGIQADLVAQKVVATQMAQAKQLARQSQQIAKPRLMIPGRRP